MMVRLNFCNAADGCSEMRQNHTAFNIVSFKAFQPTSMSGGCTPGRAAVDFQYLLRMSVSSSISGKVCLLTNTTTSATDHTTRRAILHKDGRANSSAPTPHRRPMKRSAGMA